MTNPFDEVGPLDWEDDDYPEPGYESPPWTKLLAAFRPYWDADPGADGKAWIVDGGDEWGWWILSGYVGVRADIELATELLAAFNLRIEATQLDVAETIRAVEGAPPGTKFDTLIPPADKEAKRALIGTEPLYSRAPMNGAVEYAIFNFESAHIALNSVIVSGLEAAGARKWMASAPLRPVRVLDENDELMAIAMPARIV